MGKRTERNPTGEKIGMAKIPGVEEGKKDLRVRERCLMSFSSRKVSALPLHWPKSKVKCRKVPFTC